MVNNVNLKIYKCCNRNILFVLSIIILVLITVFTKNYEIANKKILNYGYRVSTSTTTEFDEVQGIMIEKTVEIFEDEIVEEVPTETKDYKVSYYKEENYKSLGRKISIVEWKQDHAYYYPGMKITDGSDRPQNPGGGPSGGGSSGGGNIVITTPGGFNAPIAGGYVPMYWDDWFGERIHPIWGDVRFHYGIDIVAPAGTELLAVDAGTVIMVDYNGGYGNCVKIQHNNGLVTLYAHMSGFNTTEGATVRKGDVIGFVGSTGDSTGAHLHLGFILNGEFIDPWASLQGTASANNRNNKNNSEDKEKSVLALANDNNASKEKVFSEGEIANLKKWYGNEMYPTKNQTQLKETYDKYGKGKGYSYDDLYFAFYQINNYYERLKAKAGNGTNIGNLGGLIWPVDPQKYPDSKKITSLYGYTDDYYYSPETDRLGAADPNHYGIDIASGGLAPEIIAAQDGMVTFAGGSYGSVYIEGTGGKYNTKYLHLADIFVSQGQTVRQGDVIGIMGGMGPKGPRNYGVHLHFEVVDNNKAPDEWGTKNIDPLLFFNLTPDGYDYDSNRYDRNTDRAKNFREGDFYYASPKILGMDGEPDQIIWYFLKSKGVADIPIAAMMGNFFAESGYGFDIVEYGYQEVCKDEPTGCDENAHGHGLAQWTYLSRFQGLFDLATASGTTWRDPTVQLTWLWHELENGYNSDLDSRGFYQQTDLYQATYDFCDVFESPTKINMEDRLPAAQEAFDKFAGK